MKRMVKANTMYVFIVTNIIAAQLVQTVLSPEKWQQLRLSTENDGSTQIPFSLQFINRTIILGIKTQWAHINSKKKKPNYRYRRRYGGGGSCGLLFRPKIACAKASHINCWRVLNHLI